MGFRFRKSFKLAPGIRMSLSTRGLGLNVGRRGSSISISSRGVYANAGIPGVGISYRGKISGSSKRTTSRPSNAVRITKHHVQIEIGEDGKVLFMDANGIELPKRLASLAKKQLGDSIFALVQKRCDEINEGIHAVGEIHRDTPTPNKKPSFEPRLYSEPPPENPPKKKPGFWALFFRSIRDRVESENSQKEQSYLNELEEWNDRKLQFEKAESQRRRLIEKGIYSSIADMELFLRDSLQEIHWPRETNVAFEIQNEGKSAFIDVDLPEIEDMPRSLANAVQHGTKVSVKEMTDGQVQKLYMKHVHGVGFRIIGEAFASLPLCEWITLSAYSQRPSKTTGNLVDEYLYSVRVPREKWSEIHFGRLNNIDVVEALTAYDLRRKMTVTGKFHAIEPFSFNSEIKPE